jgi:hypothetical protein
MFLKESGGGHLVEVTEIQALFDPYQSCLKGRCHYGEELQDEALFDKKSLVFPSGESLPRCWVDPHYRDHEVMR